MKLARVIAIADDGSVANFLPIIETNDDNLEMTVRVVNEMENLLNLDKPGGSVKFCFKGEAVGMHIHICTGMRRWLAKRWLKRLNRWGIPLTLLETMEY